MPELLLILVIVILFGATNLPKIGSGLGQSIRGFKKAMSGEDDKPATPPASGPSDQGTPKA
jgi:sec-independent protein translocase protein TatA